MQVGQCGNRMDTKVCVGVCDENGIGDKRNYCGDNDAHLDRASVLYHEASGSKNVPRAVLFDLEHGVIGAETLSRRSASSSARAAS
jgi:tubulin beta